MAHHPDPEMKKQLGFGCMGFSAFYASAKNTTEEQAIATLKHAYDRGVNVFNSATFYGELNEVGFGHNIRLLGKFLPLVDRARVFLAVKIGMDTRCPVEKTGTVFHMHGDFEYLNSDVDDALKSLNTTYIDCIILTRVPPNVPIEDVVTAMKAIVDSGKARYIGLSEASADIIRRASAVTKVHFIEQEWSLWSRDIEEDIVPTCKELGIQILAYSPLGRGFLTGNIKNRDELDPKDIRFAGQPKFAQENFDKNYRLVQAIQSIADRHGCVAGQVALAWLLAQGPFVIPIPGTTTIGHLDGNLAALDVDLTSEDIAEINEIFHPSNVTGDRYAHAALTFQANKAKK